MRRASAPPASTSRLRSCTASTCLSLLFATTCVLVLGASWPAASDQTAPDAVQRRPPRRQLRSSGGWFSRGSGGGGGGGGVPVAPLRAGISIAYRPDELYKSQEGQDKWANEHVFRGMTHGTFVDLGCYDGISYSNTWYFERVLNWTGVCVEPNPEVFPRILSQAGRSSGVQLAVSDRKGTLPFIAAYMRSSLNASAVDYAFLRSQGVAARPVEVTVTTPGALLAESAALAAARTIDYVNIDVEQLELPILRAWPFHRRCVRVFNIENEPPRGAPSMLPEFKAILEPRGYEHVLRIGVDEVFRLAPGHECPSGGAAASGEEGEQAGGGHGGAPSRARNARHLRARQQRRRRSAR